MGEEPRRWEAKNWFNYTHMDWDTYQVLAGNFWYLKTIREIAGEGTWKFMALVADDPLPPHVSWIFKSNREVDVEIYEGITFDPENMGDMLPTKNKDRNIPDVVPSAMWENPTILDEADLVASAKLEEGENWVGGHPEFIAKRDTNYLFKFINQGVNNGWIDIDFNFYVYKWWNWESNGFIPPAS